MALQGKTRGQAPQKGLYVSSMPDQIPPEYTPWCQNVRFRFGEVLRAPGRSVVMDSHPTKLIMDFAPHMDATGARRLLGLNATSLTDNEVQQVDPATYQLMGLPLPLQNSVIDQRFSWCQGLEKTFVTRRSKITAVDIVAGVMSATPLLAPAPNNPLAFPPVCSFLEFFNNRVFAMNIEGFPNRVQWSKRAKYDIWDTVEPDGGFLDLYDGTVTPITGGKVLNDRIVIYRADSITDLVKTGDDTGPHLPQSRVNGIGCLFPWTLQSAGQFHIFVGNDYMVYKWDGAQLTAIGQPIHSYLRRLLDPNQNVWFNLPFGALFKGYKEYYLILQAPDMNYREVFIYDYMRDTWSRDYFQAVGPAPTNVLGGMIEFICPCPITTPGYDGAAYPITCPLMIASRGKDIFIIDERILGDRLSDPTTGGMDLWWDTIDMYYGEEALTNGTLQRVITSQKYPLSNTGDPPYNIEIIVDRGANIVAAVQVTPLKEHAGFEFAEFNVTSNVRRYRFHYTPSKGAVRPTWRGWSDIYVPSGDFFPINRTVINSVVPPIGTD